MNKQQIDEIRARYTISSLAVQHAIIAPAIRESCNDIPVLLDYIEELEKQLHPVGNGHDDWIKEYYPENDNSK